MIEVLYKNKDFVVIYKPQGVPSQSDASGSDDAMSAASRALEELGEHSKLWLIHRLDRVVGGVLVFARNKGAAARLSELVGGGGMEKEYLAVVHGDAPGGSLVDYIYKDAKQAKAFVVKEGKRGAKRAELEYLPIQRCEHDGSVYTLVKIKLHTGRFHQIRVQLSSRGMPIVGDGKYGSHNNRAKLPALFSSALGFDFGKERFNFTKKPDIDTYPWSIFEWSNIK